MKTQDKNFNTQSQSKNLNKQSGQNDRDQKYGKATGGLGDLGQDVSGNVASKSSKNAARDISSTSNLDDTDDEDVY